MRVCLVSREFAPFFGAGIGTYASQMSAAWVGAGHECHVLTASYPGILERGPALRPGVRFHTVDTGRGRAAMDAYRFDFLRHAMGVHEALLALNRDHPFDYIEFPEYWAEGYFALRAKRTLGVLGNAVLGVRLHTPTHECRALNREDWLDEEIATLEHAEEASIREADVLISPTRSLLDIVSERLAIPKSRPSAVVPYPFDPGTVRELGAAEPPAHDPNAAPVVLFFGRLEHRKGVHVLIDAAQLLMDRGVNFSVRFIGADTGTGPHGHSYTEWVQRRIRPAFRPRFTFEGPRPRRDLGAAIRAATTCCFPSIWENFPNACLEAMTLGAVVVGSGAGGMSEIIEHEISGLLFPSGDAPALAAALERALRDDALRARFRAAAPDRVKSLCNPAAIVSGTCAAISSARPSPSSNPQSAIRNPQSTVSVIIPFFNLARYLPRTLDSLRAQTARGFETILIDDGSTDADAVTLLKEVESGRFGPVRVIRQLNAGLSAARNTGIAAAGGRWIIPLDADDVLDPTFIEKCLAAAARDGGGGGAGLTFVTSLVEFFYDSPAGPRGGWVPIGIDRDLLAVTNCAATCTALIDRKAVLGAGGYDPWLTSYEDWDLWCKLAKGGAGGGGARGTVIPEFLIHYRCRPDSMVRTEGKARGDLIHACLIARHADLPLHPDRTARLHLARTASGYGAEARVEQLIAANIRYRVVDRMNRALKATGVQRAIKGIAVMLGANGEEAGRGH